VKVLPELNLVNSKPKSTAARQPLNPLTRQVHTKPGAPSIPRILRNGWDTTTLNQGAFLTPDPTPAPHGRQKHRKKTQFSHYLVELARIRAHLLPFRVVLNNPSPTAGCFFAANSPNWVACKVNPSKKCNLLSEHLVRMTHHSSDHLVD
jgi:hypothetical protein